MSIIHIKHKCTNARLKHRDWLTDCFISAFAHSISSGGEVLSYSSNPHFTWGWLWSKRKGSCALSLFIHHLWNDIYHCMHVFQLFIIHSPHSDGADCTPYRRWDGEGGCGGDDSESWGGSGDSGQGDRPCLTFYTAW